MVNLTHPSQRDCSQKENQRGDGGPALGRLRTSARDAGVTGERCSDDCLLAARDQQGLQDRSGDLRGFE